MDIESVRRAIQESHGEYVAAMKRGDAAALASHFTEEGILLPQNAGACRGRAAIEAWFRTWLPMMPVREFEVVTEDLRVVGDTAYEVGASKMVWESPATGRGSDESKFLMVYERGRDGKWRITHDMFNSSRPITRTP